MVAKKPGKEEKKDVLVVRQDDLCVSLWWDIRLPKWFLALDFHSKPGI